MLLFVLSFNSIGTQRDPVPARARAAHAPVRSRLALQGARRVDDLAERILAETRTLFRFDELYLVLVDRERRLLDIRVHERQLVRLPARLKPLETGLFGWLIARAEPLLVEDWQTRAAGVVAASRSDGEADRFAARHAARQRWHRAGLVDAFSTRRPASTQPPICI